MRSVRRIKSATRILPVLLLLLAPSMDRSWAQAGRPARAALQSVLVRFTWKQKGEYAPLYVALDKGYYAAEGLNVTFAEGSGSETVVKVIGGGTNEIGYGSATAVAEAASQGIKVEVIAVYQPSAPIALVSFPDVNLTTPRDLEGKRLGVSVGEVMDNMLGPFAAINHFDPSKVTIVQLDNSARSALFMARKLDVTAIFLNNELPLYEKRAGVKLHTLAIADFGLRLLGASFFVNADFARNNPDLLRALLRATAKGYLDAKHDPQGATDIMEKYLKLKMDRTILEEQVRATLDATPIPQGEPLGWQSSTDWQANLELLRSTGAIQSVKDLATYYTNEYLQ